MAYCPVRKCRVMAMRLVDTSVISGCFPQIHTYNRQSGLTCLTSAPPVPALHLLAGCHIKIVPNL